MPGFTYFFKGWESICNESQHEVSPAPYLSQQIPLCFLRIPHVPHCPPIAKQTQKDVHGAMKPVITLN